MSQEQDPVIRYSELKHQANLIEEELEMIRPQVFQLVKEQAGEENKVNVPGGYFSITKKKLWSFSETVLDLKVKVTDLETKEKQEGVAKFEEQEILVFKEIK